MTVRVFYALIYETSPWKTWEMAFPSPWKKNCFPDPPRGSRPSFLYVSKRKDHATLLHSRHSFTNSIVSRPVRATTRAGRGIEYTLKVPLMIYSLPTVRLLSHCFTTRTSRTGRGLVYTL